MEKNIKVKPFNDNALIERLRNNPSELEKFKNYLVKDFEQDKDLDALLSCLRIVVMAQRGAASKIAADSGMQRVGIYKALRKNVRPRIDTVVSILNGIGLGLSITKSSKKTA
jgi:DNA-binding phage protein